MKVVELALQGLKLLSFDVHFDQRGSLSRLFCLQSLKEAQLPTHWPQANVSTNTHKGTVRGLHFQKPPHDEPKIVRCLRGSVLDVVVDLRSESYTYLQHVQIELNSDESTAIFIPSGFAHGFQTLEDNSTLFYLMGNSFHSAAASGIRWNDKKIDVQWPEQIRSISEQDENWPDWEG